MEIESLITSDIIRSLNISYTSPPSFTNLPSLQKVISLKLCLIEVWNIFKCIKKLQTDISKNIFIILSH